MASFNKVLLMGNLTRDPQLKYLPSQTAVVEFGIACNRKFKDASGGEREEVTFVDVTSFGKQAEVINQYFTKGKPIFIEGRLKYDSWDDKNGGGKRHKLTVVVDNFQFIGGRDGGGEGGGGGGGGAGGYRGAQRGGGGGGDAIPEYDGGNEAPAPRQQSRPPARGPAKPPAQQPYNDDEQQFKDEDIPF